MFIIYTLDNPFWGEPRIHATSFERFLDRHPTPD